MKTFISLLRGINVSGQKKILMADLKAVYESLQLEEVQTYIQSGNVVFKTSATKSTTELSKAIVEAIVAQYGFEVYVLVITPEELSESIEKNPFDSDKLDPARLAITFMSAEPNGERLAQIKASDYSPDEFHVIGHYLYLHCPKGFGSTKLTNNFFEQKLKVKATSRNWRTANKLLAMTR